MPPSPSSMNASDTNNGIASSLIAGYDHIGEGRQAESRMFKFRSRHGSGDENVVKGNEKRTKNDYTIGVDGASFDISNLSCELGKLSGAAGVENPPDRNYDKGHRAGRRRSERKLMKLYPSGGSIRQKAPSIRDIDSCFTNTDPGDELTHQSSFPTENGNNFSVPHDRHGHQNGSYDRSMHTSTQRAPASHQTGGTPSRSPQTQHNNQWQPQGNQGYQSHQSHQSHQGHQGHHYGASQTANTDQARRAPGGHRNQYSSFDSGNHATPAPATHDRSYPSTSSSNQQGRVSPRKLTPEEEARRMMEERFNRTSNDTDVYQQFSRIAQKPEARKAPQPAASYPPSASSPPDAPEAPEETPRRSRRSILLRNLSSKLNLKPSAEPSFQSYEIEISPGVFLPMRCAEETEKAVLDGGVREMQCFCCETRLCFIISAEFIYCPVCSVIGPIEFPAHGANGVGLGLTQEMVDEIVQGK